jgi:hypothetical protein
MAPEMPDMSAFLNPPLCANNNKQTDGVHAVCQKNAEQCCGSCNLVQVRVSSFLTASGSIHCTNVIQVLLEGVPGRRLAAPQEDMQVRVHER